MSTYKLTCGPGSIVGIATDYRLDGLGIESLSCPDRPWGPPILLYNGYRVFPGGKERPGRDADPSPPSSAVGHERVKLYLYSPYGPYGLYRASVPGQGCTLPYSRAIPLLLLWAVRPVQSLSACTKVYLFYKLTWCKNPEGLSSVIYEYYCKQGKGSDSVIFYYEDYV